MPSKFETASNVVVVIVSLATMGFILKDRIQPRAGNHSDRKWQTVLKGSVLGVPTAQFRGANAVVVLAMSSRCRFCDQSMPVIRELAAVRASWSERVRVLAISADEQQVTRAYLKQHRVAVDDILSVPLSSIGVHATPVVLVVDSLGRIRDVWVGKLDPQRIQEIVRSVQAVCRDCAGSSGANVEQIKAGRPKQSS